MPCKKSALDCKLYTHDFFFLNDVCRLCWSTDDVIELTSETALTPEPESNNKNARFTDKVQDLLGIDMTMFSHLTNVCSKCLNLVESFAQFKIVCQDKDKKLQDLFQNAKQSINQSQPENILEISSQFTKIETDLEVKIELLEKKKERIEMDILKMEINEELSNVDMELSNFTDKDLGLEDKSNVLLLTENGDSNIEPSINEISPSLNCITCHLNLECKHHSLESNGKDLNKVHKCSGYEMKFNDKHKLSHELRNCEKVKNGYKCNICNKYLPKLNLFMHHMRMHKDKKRKIQDAIYTSNKFSKSFENSKCLKDSLQRNKKKTSFICEICGRIFTRKGNLDVHKMIHESVKPFKCPHCEYRAAQPSSLTLHIRRHTGERPYACDICPQRCISSSNLIKHRKLHFGVKDFECNICQKRFRRKDELNEHITIVHKNLKRHVCKQCGTKYTRFRSLREHLLVKHGLKVKKVKEQLLEVASGISYKRKKKTKEIGQDSVTGNLDGAVSNV